MDDSKISNLIASTLGFRSPFLWVGMLWGAVALAASVQFGSQPMLSAKWLIACWALCMVDLLALAKTISAAILLTTREEASSAPIAATLIQAMFWGSIKLLCFALFGILLWSAHQAPHSALLLGLATLIIVPLLGGVCWSQKELKYA